MKTPINLRVLVGLLVFSCVGFLTFGAVDNPATGSCQPMSSAGAPGMYVPTPPNSNGSGAATPPTTNAGGPGFYVPPPPSKPNGPAVVNPPVTNNTPTNSAPSGP